MSGLKVLVVGAGIAGPVAAFWLQKLGASITMIERSSTPRTSGQSIDVRGPAVKVMQAMGLEEAVRACCTDEVGLEKIGSTGNVVATFEATGNTAKQAITSEFEILRADLARVFVDAVKDNANIIYGEYLKNIIQRDGKCFVSYNNGTPDATFDLVIAADGMTSHTRSLLTGRAARDDLYQLGGHCAYFTIPRSSSDSEKHARFYNAPGGRSILLRPTSATAIGALLFLTNVKDERLESMSASGKDVQQAFCREYFHDAGWEALRVLEGMEAADDFYYQDVAQVRIDKWAYNRVALLGDAAYTPSPITGKGTSAAIYGAYVLAGEVSKQPENVPAALERYEEYMRPYIGRTQQITPGAPGIVNPQSGFGIAILNGIAATVSMLGLQKLGQYFPTTKGEDEPVPDYNWT